MAAVIVFGFIFVFVAYCGSADTSCKSNERYCEKNNVCIDNIYSCDGCLNFQKICSDGRCIPEYKTCASEMGTRVCTGTQKKCADGSCVHMWAMCPGECYGTQKLCPDGIICVSHIMECFAIEQQKNREDDDCRFRKRCPDGTCVSTELDCPGCCARGNCINNDEKCEALYKNWLYYFLMTCLFVTAALSLLVKLRRGINTSRASQATLATLALHHHPGTDSPEFSTPVSRRRNDDNGTASDPYAPPSYVMSTATMGTLGGTASQQGFSHHPQNLSRDPERGVGGGERGYYGWSPSSADNSLYVRDIYNNPNHRDFSQSGIPRDAALRETSFNSPDGTADQGPETTTTSLPSYPALPQAQYPGTQHPNPGYPGPDNEGPAATVPLLDEGPPPPYPGVPDMTPPPSYDDVMSRTTTS